MGMPYLLRYHNVSQPSVASGYTERFSAKAAVPSGHVPTRLFAGFAGFNTRISLEKTAVAGLRTYPLTGEAVTSGSVVHETDGLAGEQAAFTNPVLPLATVKTNRAKPLG
jgi:hypothetical protein